MIFRQLFEGESSTYTYLLGCEETSQCLLLDPVAEMVERDLKLVEDLGLRLTTSVETHIHADHVTSAGRLRALTGCKVAFPALEQLDCADIAVEEGRPISVGRIQLRPIFTPGHTDTHHSYLLETGGLLLLFSGDALLIDGCGRTDFQNGNAETLYRSLHDKVFSLPGDSLVYPAHDYQHRRVSTIAQERERNPRLGGGKELAEFVSIMDHLDLPYPDKMDIAVPANLRCGEGRARASRYLEVARGKTEQG